MKIKPQCYQNNCHKVSSITKLCEVPKRHYLLTFLFQQCLLKLNIFSMKYERTKAYKGEGGWLSKVKLDLKHCISSFRFQRLFCLDPRRQIRLSTKKQIKLIRMHPIKQRISKFQIPLKGRPRWRHGPVQSNVVFNDVISATFRVRDQLHPTFTRRSQHLRRAFVSTVCKKNRATDEAHRPSTVLSCYAKFLRHST